MARNAESVPRSATPEQTTTGMGSSSMICFKNVNPSMHGICRSRTMTSGRKRCIFSMAMSGSEATTVCIPCSTERSELMTWRTTAESSTTRTLSSFPPFAGTAFRFISFHLRVDGGHDRAEAIGETARRFGVAQEEEPIVREAIREALEDVPSLRNIEVDEDIAAKNDVEL